MTYVLAWTSALDDQHPMYLSESEKGWNATDIREEATRYATPQQAIDAWLSKHAVPDRYVRYVQAGVVRAEIAEQYELDLST